MRITLATLALSLVATVAAAQTATITTTAPPKANPLTAHGKFSYGMVTTIVLRSAHLMPEEHYAFKPVDSVRTFGQIVAHVADSQYAFCSVASSEKNPRPQVEKNKASKADLIAALNEAVAFCNAAWATMDDTTRGAEEVKFGQMMMPRLGILNVNLMHTMEHYGNLVTYMRMKNVVPPTSDPEFMKQSSAR
jgi:uncharacterized damage-inducible protein DinB